jgi:type II secretory pathway component PulJ
MNRPGAQGVTLVEVVVVMALATLVVMGMISFYISSQSTWMASSTQALAQRDATLLVETISKDVRAATLAQVLDYPDSLHQALILRHRDLDSLWCFWLDSMRVYQGPAVGARSGGPVVVSPVTRLQFDTLTRVVEIRLIELQSDRGESVRIASAATLYNRAPGAP